MSKDKGDVKTVENPEVVLSALSLLERQYTRLMHSYAGLQSARERGAPMYEVRAFLTAIAVSSRQVGSTARNLEKDLADHE